MARPKAVYVCSACGQSSPKWLGRCPGCEAWNSLVEELRGAAPVSITRGAEGHVVSLGEVCADDVARYGTGIGELDRVLGGGIVPGGVVLLGGEPGIGKSTLLMQALAGLAAAGRRVLYVTGEESAGQVALRARRLDAPGVEGVRALATTELGAVERAAQQESAEVLVVDSVQTLRCADLESAPGSVSQVREVASRLTDAAKRDGVALLLIGHVTKEGAIAGPKVLEHLVDTVLSFEGDSSHAFRLVRVTKNRFGGTHEVGVFEMGAAGLVEVSDPSRLLLAERPAGASGSVVLPSAEGHRSLLVEVQALVAGAAHGVPRRVATGLDANRLSVLLAVLHRKAGVQVIDMDVFASVAGGLRVNERALDLALAAAVVSSHRGRAADSELAVFGEVGLAGEVRGVPRAAARIAEAKKRGLLHVVLPRTNAESLSAEERDGVTLHPVTRLGEALEALF
jgi:DNA repair protein RadA/Sms